MKRIPSANEETRALCDEIVAGARPTKRTFRAYRDGVEVGKTTTLRADRAYVAAVVLTYPADLEGPGGKLSPWAGRVKVSHWSSDLGRAQRAAEEDRRNLEHRGWRVELVTDVRLDPTKVVA